MIESAVVVLLFVLNVHVYSSHFLRFNEGREDLVVISDRLMNTFRARDTSVLVNMIIYPSMIFFLITSYTRLLPFMFHLAILYWIRALLLYFAPLKPMQDIVPLQDVVVQRITGSQNATNYVCDLFCSGHTCMMLSLGAYALSYNWLYYCMTIIMGGALVLSKTHYTIDILVAFPVTYSVFSLSSHLIMRNDVFYELHYLYTLT